VRIKPGKNRSSFNNRLNVIANERIRANEVRVLDEYGEMISVMSVSEALTKAKSEEKDLILINGKANPAIVKIIDLAKYKYQEQQKKAKSRKKAKIQEIKEVRFKPFMDQGDFETRLRQVNRFLKKGDKVRMSLEFKGRAITKKEFGYEMFDKVIEATSELATVEMAPKLMGKKLIAQLMPVKKKA
jgi:translation initiation factor IF-3